MAMSQRSQWRFAYQTEGLATAAKGRVEHHRERERWWRDELSKAEGDLRETGVEFREMPETGHVRLDAVLDPQKQRRVNESRTKVREHGKLAEEYEMYLRAFKLNPGAVLELNADDIQFFGL